MKVYCDKFPRLSYLYDEEKEFLITVSGVAADMKDT